MMMIIDDDDDDDGVCGNDGLREFASASGRDTGDGHEFWTIFIKSFPSFTCLQLDMCRCTIDEQKNVILYDLLCQ